MLTAIFLTLVVVAVSVVAFLLTRKRPKAVAPEATRWVGPIGLVWLAPYVKPESNFIDAPEIYGIVANMEAFTGKKISPIVVSFVEGLIPLEDGRTAAGIYHPASLWTHAWIELSVGGGDWWPTTLRETAFEHELLHHATGLGDTFAFREILERYKEKNP